MKWKRIALWISGIVFGLLLFLAIAGYFVLRSQGFHRYVLAKIVQEGNEATGGKVEVRNFDFRFSSLTAHLYGFTIHGTESEDVRPLLQVDKITVGLKILSVIHGRVNLSELLVDHPVLNLIVDKSGRNNISQPNAPKSKSSQTDVFDVAAGHVLISNGEIDYNDHKSAINADVQHLRAETRFNSLTATYSGAISYHDGRVKYAGISPLSHSLDMQFSATRSALDLPSLVLTVGSSKLSLQANVENYNNPKVEGKYNIQIHAQDVAELAPAAKPSGDIYLSGKLSYQSKPDHPFLRDVWLDGQLRSNFLKITSQQAQIEFKKLDGRYHMENGDLKAPDLSVNLLGGKLAATLSAYDLDRMPRVTIHIGVSGISLQAAETASSSASTKTFPLTGTLHGTADTQWNGSSKNLTAHSDLSIQASATSSSGSPSIPVNGVVHLSYDGVRNIVVLRQTEVHTPQSSLSADGEVGDHSSLTIHAGTRDLREIAMLVSLMRPTNARSFPALEMSGGASLNATVKGTLSQPAIDAQLNAQHFTVEGSTWSSLNLTADANPWGISIRQGSLISARQGQVSFAGKAALHNWSYRPSDQIAFNASVKQMPVAEIEEIARLHYPVDGDLSGDISFRGSEFDPSGGGSLHLTKARVASELVQNLDVQFKAGSGSIHSSLNVRLPAGSATANLDFIPKSRAYKLEVRAPGFVLSKLQTLRDKNLPLEGTLSISANGLGTLDNPNLHTVIQSSQLQFRQNSITGLKAELNVANHKANLVLSSDIAESTIRAQGTINLSGDYYTEATIDTSKVPLEPLLAIYVPNHPKGFQGTTELHATFKGPLKDRAHVEAHVVIPTLTASYESLEVSNATPIRIDYANSVIAIQPSEIKGTDSDLKFQGRMPLSGGNAMAATARGTVNLRLLQIFSPDIKSSGTMVLEVNSTGPISHPEMQGQVHLADASLYTASAPLGLGHANGVVDIGVDQLRITRFTGQVGGGEVSAGGTITYRPQMQFNIAAQAKSVRLLYPEGLRTVLDGDLNLTGNTAAAVLGGRVLIDNLSFTPDFDISTFMSQFTGPSVPATSPGLADAVKLNISVQSSGDLAATSSQVSLQGQANLRAVGTAANPVIVGRADLNSGDVFFLNNRYQIQRGVFTFNNPNQTEPVVNLAAVTTIQQYNLTLNVNGPLDKLQTSYVSDPPLSTVDIINLIARGETTQQADTTNLSANSIIAQGVASRLSSGVQKLAGLSSLSIDPLLGGNNSNPSARIALQQRLTKNFLFTFSTDVTQPQSQIVQGEYQLSKRWSVSANRDATGGVAVDGKFHTNF